MRPGARVMFVFLLLLGACRPSDPQTDLENAAKLLSKPLPQKLDANTVWINVEAGDHILIYTYEIRGIPSGRVESMKGDLESNVRSALKKNKAALFFYVNNKIPMKYVYTDTKGEQLITFTVNPWEL